MSVPEKAKSSFPKRQLLIDGFLEACENELQYHKGYTLKVRLNERSANTEFQQVVIGADGEEKLVARDWFEPSRFDELQYLDEFRGAVKWTHDGDKPAKLTRTAFQELYEGAAARNRIDPFNEWLDNLPDWDEVPRISKLLYNLFDTDGELAEWASLYPFIGALQRAADPGSEIQQMPVLIGGQNIGKSYFISALVPPEFRSQWFSDSLRLNDRSKERMEVVKGKVVVEVSEMTGIKKADVEDLKAFLTRQTDEARLSYDKNTTKLERRFVMIGTSNEIGALPNDSTGNRRFVPIKLNGQEEIRIKLYMEEFREQLWAEAIYLYSSGKVTSAVLPDHLKELASSEAEEYRYEPYEEIEEVIASLESELSSYISSFQLGKRVNAKFGDSDSSKYSMRQIKPILIRRDWKAMRKRVDGNLLRVYFPPGKMNI